MDYLRQPYPFYHQGRSLIKYTLLIFFIGYLFEYLFVPFPRTPEEHLYSYEIITLAHVCTAAVIYLIFFSILNRFVYEDDWKVYKEFVAVFFLLVAIGLGEWGIRPIIYTEGGYLSLGTFFEELWHAQLSGGLIYLLVTLVNVRFLEKRHSYEAGLLNSKSVISEKKQVAISTQNLSDDFVLNPDAMICAKAEGNYIELFLRADERTDKLLKRITLQNFTAQLAEFSSIIRTHRSYLVNVSYVEKVEGNAQGYLLTLRGLDIKVPVSRKNLKSFKSLMS